ncbi:hypothetical protein GIB67_028598 [Kingdonia uniflora]|uniref:Gamma-tubulin complex component n=1 Tax=Kingdonia uniflora TaxID=39325 RepID=A0A7J7KZL1_9MAGN|nr:hypothetical protein GIB67_028598 [Kingdonia uniflora]
MLHELLLALIGYTGDLIIDQREHHNSLDNPLPGDCTFKLAPDLSFIEIPERDAIERLISLGYYYKELDNFATRSRDLSWTRSSSTETRTSGKPSVYRRAIANGIVEILSVYRSAVLHVEQKLLSDPIPILATVTHGLNKFFVLLPPLYKLIVEMECDDVRGGQLLNLLHKRCHCGVPELQACIQRLLWHGHQVMYHQLASWMVYGILQDQHGEFFIRRQEDMDVESELGTTQKFDKVVRKSPNHAFLTDWHLGFHIFLDMLPDHIHMRVAESILFAGKAVRVLRNPSFTFRSQDVVSSQQVSRGSHKVVGYTGRFAFQKQPVADTKMIEEELLPQSEADKIDTMLQELKESSEFHKRSFESAVDSVRAIAASHLWQLVVVRADLNGHLKALKDYFLLAKGDFFQCFLEESRQLMHLPPRHSSAEADLMVPFRLAAIKTVGDEDKYFSKVSLRIPSFGIPVASSQAGLLKVRAGANGNINVVKRENTSSELPLDGWDGIALDYSVTWPLQLFFTQEVLSKYLRVFQYLLRLKRTQMELEKSWASVDVIESQWNVLQARVKDSHDFTELVGFHQEYLSALISQSFLDIGSVSRILDSVMKLCLQFCWNIETESNPNTSELEHITELISDVKSNRVEQVILGICYGDLCVAIVISTMAMLSQEDLDGLWDKFGWKDSEVEDYMKSWIEQRLEKDECILLWRKANEVWIPNRHGLLMFLCLKKKLTREAFQMLENSNVRKYEFQTSVGVVTKDSMRFNGVDLKIFHYKETAEKEGHCAIDVGGGKDGDVLKSSRLKSHDRVATLMREVYPIDDSDHHEVQLKKTNTALIRGVVREIEEWGFDNLFGSDESAYESEEEILSNSEIAGFVHDKTIQKHMIAVTGVLASPNRSGGSASL